MDENRKHVLLVANALTTPEIEEVTASINQMKEDFGFSIKSDFVNGIEEFSNWYKKYYAI